MIVTQNDLVVRFPASQGHEMYVEKDINPSGEDYRVFENPLSTATRTRI